ncbi:MAG: chromate transporter [Bryobacterales bacterium]|nr:chromate transporter [Bryobacterales bacterium]
MTPLLIYLLFLKATLTSFSGMGSLPIIRQEFVVERHLLTDRQLATALAVGRAGPGPHGLYMVAAGYFIAGVPGAAAGCAALMTPAFLILPLLLHLGRHRDHPRVRGAIRGVTLAAGALVVAAALPMARDAWTGPLPAAISLASFGALLFTRLDTLWIVLGSALAGLAGMFLAG